MPKLEQLKAFSASPPFHTEPPRNALSEGLATVMQPKVSCEKLPKQGNAHFLKHAVADLCGPPPKSGANKSGHAFEQVCMRGLCGRSRSTSGRCPLANCRLSEKLGPPCRAAAALQMVHPLVSPCSHPPSLSVNKVIVASG